MSERNISSVNDNRAFVCYPSSYNESTNASGGQNAKLTFDGRGKSAVAQVHAKQCISPELLEVRKIAELLNTLPPTFGLTLSAHMKRLHVTNETLAERLSVSARWISSLRSASAPKLKMPKLVAICLCLHLEPELSEDLIHKAGQHFLPVEEHVFYRYLLRTRYTESLENCNDVLQQAGLDSLCADSE